MTQKRKRRRMKSRVDLLLEIAFATVIFTAGWGVAAMAAIVVLANWKLIFVVFPFFVLSCIAIISSAVVFMSAIRD